MSAINWERTDHGIEYRDTNGNLVATATYRPADGLFRLEAAEPALLPEGMPPAVEAISLKTAEWLALAFGEHLATCGY
jgi:hypothetical protein